MTATAAASTAEYHLRKGDEEDCISIETSSNSSKNSDGSSASNQSSEHGAAEDKNGQKKKKKTKKKRSMPIIRNVCCSKIPEDQHAQRVLLPREHTNIDIDAIRFEKPKKIDSAMNDETWHQFNEALKSALSAHKKKTPEQLSQQNQFRVFFLCISPILVGGILIVAWKVLPPVYLEALFLMLLVFLVVGIMWYHFHKDGLRHLQMKRLVKSWKPTMEASGCTVDYIIPPPNSPVMMGGCGCPLCRQPYLYFGLITDSGKENSNGNNVINPPAV